ncbi:MAG TPA: pyridoxal phosphate-dependent aminotransferase [Aldersonia sp.]
MTSTLHAPLPTRIAVASRRPATLGSAPAGAFSLAIGEPYAGTPGPVVDAAVAALHAGRTRYESFSGSPRLRERLAAHLTARAGTTVDTGNVVISHGGSAGLAATVLSVVGPGDTVVLPEPTYSLYADQVAMAGGDVRWVGLRPDGGLALDALEAAVDGARLVIVCNPGNPTGAVIPPEDLATVVDLTARAGCYLLVDEAYGDIVFDGLTPHTAASAFPAEHVLCAGTFSKTFAMTGWRVGWIAAASTDVAARINLVHRTINGPLSTFVQDAAAAALELPDSHFDDLRRGYQHRRDIVVDALRGHPRIEMARPRGAFYAFPRIDTGVPTADLVDRLARAGVLVRDGAEFGPSGARHVRLSFATGIDELRTGLDRLTAVLAGETP